MKKNATILTMAIMLIGLFTFNAHAQFSLFFDENGNGEYSLNGGALTTATSGTDLSPDLYSNALYYDLPESVGIGPVTIWDDFVGGTLSDVLLFEPTRMWFYSEPGLDLADLSLLDWQDALSTYGSVTNGVIENSDGSFVYNVGNIYNGMSSPNVIPEPSTFLLLGGGLAGLAFVARRRRKE